ncbi:MAG: FliH/SctL family protein [Planctomycetota bacterium]|jgi:flagellar assembly protein FliH
MGLIKNTDARRVVKHGFQDMGDLRKQAERVLQDARAEAQRIVDEARGRAESLLAESEPRGYAEGKQRGLGEGREEGRRLGHEEAINELRSRLEQLIPAWTEALESFEAQRKDLLLAAREDILELALTMGSKITHRVIETDPNVVTDQVAEALALVADASAVTVSVNPKDRKLVEKVLGGIVEKIGICTHVDLREDDKINAGGCVLNTGKGRIDATVDRQIERIVDTLLPPGKS